MVFFNWSYLIIKNYRIINRQFQVGFIPNNSKLIAEYAIGKRLFIPYDSIPEKVVNSFLSQLRTKTF